VRRRTAYRAGFAERDEVVCGGKDEVGGDVYA
jgi:hypothetical protein